MGDHGQPLGSADLRLMQGLAQEVTALRPDLLNADATIGELAWVWGSTFDALHQYWRHRLWFVDGKLAGWGWACLPYRIPRGDGTFRECKTANLLWQVHPNAPDLLSEILDWYDGVAGEVDRTMVVQSADVRAREIVTAHGYAFDAAEGGDDGSWGQWNTRELNDVPNPLLDKGFRFLAAEDVSVADAVAAHRGAWPKSNLTGTAFERVQRTWPYRGDLHVLIQAPDGTLAASAIIWLDQTTRTAEFEPVGTHQKYRRLGLGTALQLHGMRLARKAGASRMFVACLGSPTQPAARNLYYGVGFRPISKDLPQLKTAN